MKARTRRKLEMGARALLFCRLETESSRGYGIAVAQLEACLTRGRELIDIQRQSLIDEHAVSGRRRKLVRLMRRAHLAHIKRVAHTVRENPSLAQMKLWRGTIPYLEFQSLARSILMEARNQQDLLIKHGLSETLLDRLKALLDEFDELMRSRLDARRNHIIASVELDRMGDEVVRIVRIVDALNQDRFQNDIPRLRAWASLTNLMNPSSSTRELPPAA
jgi:hypothetical protein